MFKYPNIDIENIKKERDSIQDISINNDSTFCKNPF